jgi:hypothetical protein
MAGPLYAEGQMKRRQVLTGILVAASVNAFAALPALAATFVEQVVTQLRAQGFDAIKVERTLLGRTRIAALRADGSREIVLNPNTGEILRDLWTSQSGDVAGSISIGGDNGTDGNSGPGGGDDGDDGDDGEGHGGHGGGDGDDDNSGSGGGGGDESEGD